VTKMPTWRGVQIVSGVDEKFYFAFSIWEIAELYMEWGYLENMPMLPFTRQPRCR
jgi:hypothetical protein